MCLLFLGFSSKSKFLFCKNSSSKIVEIQLSNAEQLIFLQLCVLERYVKQQKLEEKKQKNIKACCAELDSGAHTMLCICFCHFLSSWVQLLFFPEIASLCDIDFWLFSLTAIWLSFEAVPSSWFPAHLWANIRTACWKHAVHVVQVEVQI